MEEEVLMEIVFTNIQCKAHQFFRLAAKIICHRGTEAQKNYIKMPRKMNRERLIPKFIALYYFENALAC